MSSTSSSRDCYENEDYFSIDSILALNERVPCKFEKNVAKLGFLSTSTETEEIQAGTKLELPLWVVKDLVRQNLCKAEVPKAYKETMREILSADATTVDFTKHSHYYYKFGLYLLQFQFPDTEEISKSLIQAFQQRLRKIIDYSQNALKGNIHNDFSLTLEIEEKELYLVSQKSIRDFENWQSRKTSKILTAEVINNHKKRKRV